MSLFATTTEAVVMGLVAGAGGTVFLYLGYLMLMLKVEERVREKVKEKVDRHEDIHHGD